ncbi:hypothetical protein Hamer_G020669 [Homarus americanus]|uniref:Uncharacterized protein n=1 Tax=Homarus americanus TaxID=6706 RepID=A0A8J5K8M0_HOMAM|nr:hypothetical protein Hamer_G020669 [Homarus americanus]
MAGGVRRGQLSYTVTHLLLAAPSSTPSSEPLRHQHNRSRGPVERVRLEWEGCEWTLTVRGNLRPASGLKASSQEHVVRSPVSGNCARSPPQYIHPT